MTVLSVKRNIVRHVRTPEGAERYGQPIGTVIVLDADGNVISARPPAGQAAQPTERGLPAAPEDLDAHFRDGLPGFDGWAQDHGGGERSETQEQKDARNQAAAAAKREVVDDLTRRLDDLPDEALIPAEHNRQIGRLRDGSSVLLRIPRPNDYDSPDDPFSRRWDYLEVMADAFEKAGGLDGKGAPLGAERVSPDDLREWRRREAVSGMVALWAMSSNSNNPRALIMQDTAERVFGLTNVQGWDVPMTPEDRAAMPRLQQELSPTYEAFLRAQYAATQARLRADGITDVRLYRGVRAYRSDTFDEGWEDGGDQPVTLRPMSSFTTDRRIAAKFATQSADAGARPWVMETIVPVERILSTPRTGVGCLSEAEMVVLAGEGDWRLNRVTDRDALPEQERLALEEQEAAAEAERITAEAARVDAGDGPPPNASLMATASGQEVYVEIDGTVSLDKPTVAAVYDPKGRRIGTVTATSNDPSVNSFQASDLDGNPVGEAGPIADALDALDRVAQPVAQPDVTPQGRIGEAFALPEMSVDLDDIDPALHGDIAEGLERAVDEWPEIRDVISAVNVDPEYDGWGRFDPATGALTLGALATRDPETVRAHLDYLKAGGHGVLGDPPSVADIVTRQAMQAVQQRYAQATGADRPDLTGQARALALEVAVGDLRQDGDMPFVDHLTDALVNHGGSPRSQEYVRRVRETIDNPVEAPGGAPEDDSPLTITYGRNREGVGANGPGDGTFGQDIEPAGRYMIDATGTSLDPERWETGDITFDRPLRIPAGGGYADADNWKRALSARYGGLTGEALSRAVVADGYDAIVTYDKYGNDEIVDLSMFRGDTPGGDPVPEVREQVTVAALRKGDSVLHDGQMRRIRATPIEHGKASRRLWLEGVEDVVTLRRTAKIERLQQKYVPQTGIPRFVESPDLAYDDVAYGRQEVTFEHVRHGIGFDLEGDADVFDERILDVSARAARDTLHRHEGLDGLTITVNPTQGAVATANGPRGFGMTPEHASEDGCRAFATEWHGMGIAGGKGDDPDDTLRHVCTHELGHVINARLDGLSDEVRAEVAAIVSEPVTPREMGYTAGDLDTPQERWRLDGLTANGVRCRSVYSMENEREFFAEAYLDAVRNGDQAADASKRIMALVNKHFGGQADDTGTRDRGDAAQEARGGAGEAPDVDLTSPAAEDIPAGMEALPGLEDDAPYVDEVMSVADLFAIAMQNNLDPDSPKIQALSADIRASGLREPLQVEETNKGRVLTDGTHRLLAADAAGLTELPVRVYANTPAGRAAANRAMMDRETDPVDDDTPAGQEDESGDDYRMDHQPPEDGAPLHDLTEMFGEDVYEHPEWYGHGSGEAWERETYRIVKRMRGKPDAMVTLYRAAPEGVTHFDPGNWVALAEGYARQHAMHETDPALDMPVYKITVPASQVRNGGNDVIEWGYFGPRMPVERVDPK